MRLYQRCKTVNMKFIDTVIFHFSIDRNFSLEHISRFYFTNSSFQWGKQNKNQSVCWKLYNNSTGSPCSCRLCWFSHSIWWFSHFFHSFSLSSFSFRFRPNNRTNECTYTVHKIVDIVCYSRKVFSFMKQHRITTQIHA